MIRLAELKSKRILWVGKWILLLLVVLVCVPMLDASAESGSSDAPAKTIDGSFKASLNQAESIATANQDLLKQMDQTSDLINQIRIRTRRNKHHRHVP